MNAPRFSAIASLLFPVLLSASHAHAFTNAHLWSRGFGGTSGGTAWSVAADASGNAYIAGSFFGTVDFGGVSLVSAGGSDIFLARYYPGGALAWAQRFGALGADAAQAVVVSPSGDCYVTGSFSNTVDFGGGNLVSAGNDDIFFARYNANGVHVSSRRVGGTSFDQGQAIAVDVFGNIFLTGRFGGSVGFGSNTLVSAGSADIFITKYTNVGVFAWSGGFGAANFDWGFDITLDSMGYPLITGSFQNSVNFGGGVLVSAGGADIFVARYHQLTGAHQWSARYGGALTDEGWGIAGTTDGNVILAGYFDGTVNFGGGNLVSSGASDMVLASYTLLGAHNWSLRGGSSSSDFGRSIAVDAGGNIFTSGTSDGPPDLGGGLLPYFGVRDGYIARYSATGAHQWSRTMGGAGTDNTHGVAVDNLGHLFAGGNFDGTANFGGADLTATSTDVFLAKYSADFAEPIVSSIADIGNDQGRKVKIRFSKAGADDAAASLPVQRYVAFRRDEPPPAASSEPVIGSRALETGWTQVGSVEAFANSDYGIDVPTIGDSTIALGQYYSTFFVRAATDLPATYYDSPPDSGYSLDNLSPGVPLNFVYESGELTWDESAADDFDFFTVYGANADNFGTAVVVDYSVAPTLDVSASPYVFYFVTATDFSGNEGRPAKVNTLSNAGGTPKSYVLSVSNYPNPFNPRTTVSYTLPARGHVSVRVYDARGAFVATLVDGERAAGAYSADWNPGAAISSGIYFARIEHNGATRSKKMVLLK